MRVRRGVLIGLLGASALGVAGVIAEWVWRGLARASYAAACARFESPLFELRQDDQIIGLRADVDWTAGIAVPGAAEPLRVRYRTNAEGLRRHERWPPPMDPSTERVLCIGDSYTFGIGVEDGEAWPHQLEARLREAGRGCFCINAGVPGHNSEQELARLRELLPRCRPELVIVAFVMNDAEPPVMAPLSPAYTHRGCRSWLLEDGKRVLDLVGRAFVDDRSLWPSRIPVYDFDYRADFAPGSERGERCLAALRAMRTLCRDASTRFLVAVIPDFTLDLDDRYPLHAIHARLLAFGTQEDIAITDLWPGLMTSDAPHLRVPGDGHPNAEGQRRIAAALVSRVVESLDG